jgi:hypothetical protein
MEHTSSKNITSELGKGQGSSPRPRFDWPKLRKAIEVYERLGLRYIPLVWGDKKPAIKAWEPFQSRAPTLEELVSWFGEGKPNGIGIICGTASGGLVALCFNDPSGAEEFFGSKLWHRLITSTFVSQTPRGHHVLLRSDTPIKSQFVCKGDNKSWLEIRADGNYIAAPPSLHPSGVVYQAIGVESIVKPKNLATYIDERLAQLGVKVRGDEEASNEPGWIEKVLQGVPEGERDVTCTKLAGYFRNKLPQAVCLAILVPWGERCVPSFSPEDVQKVVTSVYRYEPIARKSGKLRKPDVFGNRKAAYHAGD